MIKLTRRDIIEVAITRDVVYYQALMCRHASRRGRRALERRQRRRGRGARRGRAGWLRVADGRGRPAVRPFLQTKQSKVTDGLLLATSRLMVSADGP